MSLAMKKIPDQAPMHKGRTQGAEPAGFGLEFELQSCWGPFQPELSNNLMHSPGKNHDLSIPNQELNNVENDPFYSQFWICVFHVHGPTSGEE